MPYNHTSNHSRLSVGRVKRLPQALIIGARKCGTRALLKFLQINPQIRAAQNEVHFFDRDDRFRLGLEWYKDQMETSSENELSIEKTPSYFVTKGVAERVAAMNSSIKLIVILRNPVTRLISDFSQIVANKIEISSTNETTPGEIEEAWQEASKLFEQQLLRQDGSLKDRWRAIQIGMYSKYLEKWLKVFPLSQFHFVNGERLIVDPTYELNKVERFLALTRSINRDDFIFDSRKGFYCIAAKNENISNLNGSVASSNIEVRCLSKHKGRRHISVSAKVKNKLRQFYRPYNEYLFSTIGNQFDWIW